MAPIIIWIIIIFAVVAFNKKSVTIRNPGKPDAAKGQQAQKSTGQVKKEADPWAFDRHSDDKGKQQALKERLAKKYQRPASGSSGGGDILSRAKASVEEDFGQTREQEEAERRQRKREEEVRRQRRQKEAAWQQAQGQRGPERKHGPTEHQAADVPYVPLAEGLFLDGGLSLSPGMPVAGQQESIDMGAVYDLMVKGPKLELAFERDFIAEGVEMLNRIQA